MCRENTNAGKNKLQRHQKRNSLSPKKHKKAESTPRNSLTPIKRRTMADIIKDIKENPIEEEEVGSDSDVESEGSEGEEHQAVKAGIINLLDQVTGVPVSQTRTPLTQS